MPNPSFESKNFCPQYTNQIKAASGWKNCGETPDYFNACSPMYFNVPNTQFGFQEARSGIAMAGLILFYNPSGPADPNYREFIGSQLTNTLQIGEKYFMSFYVNYSWFNSYQAIACNNIGIKFSTMQYDSMYPPVLNNFAHLYSNQIITDTVGWVKLSDNNVSITVSELYALKTEVQVLKAELLQLKTLLVQK